MTQRIGHKQARNHPPALTPPLEATVPPASLAERDRVVSVHTEIGLAEDPSRVLDPDEAHVTARCKTVGDDESSLCCCSEVVYPLSESEVAGTHEWNQAEIEGLKDIPFGCRWLFRFFGQDDVKMNDFENLNDW